MCFSAAASFSVAAATAIIGIATVRHVRDLREWPLAVVPLLFAFQQAVEGLLWLDLSGGYGAANEALLSFAFLIFAFAVWPIYTPLAVLALESGRGRKRVLWALALVGAALSIHLTTRLFADPAVAAIREHSIAYSSSVNPLSVRQIPYLLCTVGAPLLSSHRIIRGFGVCVLVGFLVSTQLYLASYVSVWCFFAAACSMFLYLYFKHAVRPARLLHS